MKTLRFWGIEIKLGLSIKMVNRVTYPIPDWANDLHLNKGGKGEWGTSDGNPKIIYYKGSLKHEIEIPKCEECVQIYFTPRHTIKEINGRWEKQQSTNRIITIDIYK